MAYANVFQTHVTNLRFDCLNWTIQLRNQGLNMDFMIYEDEVNNQIDFEIILREPSGNPIDRIQHDNIIVNSTVGDFIKILVNIFFQQYGAYVN